MYQESEMNKFMSLNIHLLRIVTQRSFNQFIKKTYDASSKTFNPFSGENGFFCAGLTIASIAGKV
jgi:hypothetical protein